MEIIKGPMAALYGSDALGGVINIITKSPQEGMESSISVSGGTSHKGEAGQLQVDADLRGRSGATGYSAWFSAQSRDAYTETETANIRVGQGGEPRRPSELQGQPNSPFGQLRNNLDDQYAVDTRYRAKADVMNVGGKLTHQLNEQLELNARLSLMTETHQTGGIANVYESNQTNPQNNQKIRVQNVPYRQAMDNERIETGVGAKLELSEQLRLEWQSDLSGLEISIDDFGTGYSSLSVIQHLAFDRLKIDRSFICNIAEKEQSYSIVAAIITMAHQLGLKVLAEGIENQAQLDCLIALGCDEGQGYFLGRPQRGADFLTSFKLQ